MIGNGVVVKAKSVDTEEIEIINPGDIVMKVAKEDKHEVVVRNVKGIYEYVNNKGKSIGEILRRFYY